MSRIVITTFGSLGDLHPYIAVGQGLKKRGHEVVFATSPCYRQKIESLGLGFHPVRPDSHWLFDPEKVRRLSHPRWGLLRVGREWVMPALRETYADTLAAAEGADLLVTMLANYASRLVAEKTGIPWVSAVHLPLGFVSSYDPSVLDIAPHLSRWLHHLGPTFWRPLWWVSKRASRVVARPWYELRAELGLPPTNEGNPFADSHSPRLVLALFSKLLADKQPDWPPQTVITGFPFPEQDGEAELPLPLARFLDSGLPPIVFTLGSAVSIKARSFYEQSIAAAKLIGQRAVLVVGKGNSNLIPRLSADAIGVEYAPFGQLFPKAAAVVHHGGIGTTGLSMRAGRPVLIVPFAWDQPDNAARASRLGIARTLSSSRYTAARAAKQLQPLVHDRCFAERAAEVAARMLREDGVQAACDALERLCRATVERSHERIPGSEATTAYMVPRPRRSVPPKPPAGGS